MRDDGYIHPEAFIFEFADGSWKPLDHSPTGRFDDPVVPFIDPVNCRGCTLCIRKCPAGAIRGERRRPHVIDSSLCTGCMTCVESCRLEAIIGAL